MEGITRDHLSKLFLVPINSIVPIYQLYLFKEQGRDSILLILSGNLPSSEHTRRDINPSSRQGTIFVHQACSKK